MKKKETRSKFINVRYSKKEIELIDEYVKNTKFSRSEFLRKLSLNEIQLDFPKVAEVENPAIGNIEEIKLLSNIANNINQIAKIVNQKKIAPNDQILKSIQNQIANYLDTKF